MVFVSPKTLEQQDIQSAHRIRQGYLDNRTGLGNRIRGILHEYGVVIPQGIHKLRHALPGVLEDAENELTVLARHMLQDLYEELVHLHEKILKYDRILANVCEQKEVCRRLLTIPGVGIMTATCLYSTLGDGKAFHNGRHVSAFLGLVPKQHSSGNKQRLLGMSKHGDKYLRTLLTHGGRSVLRLADKKEGKLFAYAKRLKQTKHANKVAVAIASKLARTAWAVLTSEEVYREVI